jgi:hypothetical protein
MVAGVIVAASTVATLLLTAIIALCTIPLNFAIPFNATMQ